MKIKCDRAKLLDALQTVASVVPVRSPKPILQNVKLEVSKDAAILMATDLEIGIRIAVDRKSPAFCHIPNGFCAQTIASGSAWLSASDRHRMGVRLSRAKPNAFSIWSRCPVGQPLRLVRNQFKHAAASSGSIETW